MLKFTSRIVKSLSLSTLILFTSFAFSADNNTVYVSPKGGDVEFLNNKIETVKLITAFEQAKPGTTIQLTPGIYTVPYLLSLTATEEKPLVIRGLGKDTLYDGRLKKGDDGLCLGFKNSAWIVVENIHFKNCWRAAVTIKNSQYLSFNNLHTEGSRYMIYARGAQTHHLLVEHSEWNQDPSGDLWHTIPWAESHHGKHDYFNGGMLAAKEILGSVVFRHNTILNAFNGFRLVGDVTASHVQNANVEVYRNSFQNIRDNPIEPEDSAHNWWIHHNQIKNAHALFSFTEIGGGDWYVFNNIGWFDAKPGGDDHNGGKIFKFTKNAPLPSKPFYIFNNSWYSRSPLVAGGQTRGVTFWNNAIYFVEQDLVSKAKYWHKSYQSDYNLSNLDFSKGLEQFGQDKHSIKSVGEFFIDGPSGDFRLTKNSAAIDQGKIIKLAGWKSEYRGTAPDIGAFEGDTQPVGPAFRFDASTYQEAPRIVQVKKLIQIDPLVKQLNLTFSVPLKEQNNLKASVVFEGENEIAVVCTIMNYELICDLPVKRDVSKLTEVILPKIILGQNGLPATLWAAPSDDLKISLSN